MWYEDTTFWSSDVLSESKTRRVVREAHRQFWSSDVLSESKTNWRNAQQEPQFWSSDVLSESKTRASGGPRGMGFGAATFRVRTQ